MEKRLLSAKELSVYIAVPIGSIYTMVCMRRIPQDCVVKIGRSLKFERTAVDAWVNQQKALPGPVQENK